MRGLFALGVVLLPAAATAQADDHASPPAAW